MAKETWIRKLKRRLFAKPVLSIKDGYYTMAWHWKNGECEVVEKGICYPGGFVEVPSGCKVVGAIPQAGVITEQTS